MLEVSAEQVAQLTDADLRTLVCRLCEAELREAGQPLSSLTAGGHQDASDGGIDVRVSLVDTAGLDFIPRRATGFQVKKPDMPPKAIESEMRPKGVLRPSIAALAESNGSYVIVSAQGSSTDTGYKRRVAAMREAASNGAGDLHVDFYDQARMARWVNQYPGVALWLRDRIGEPLRGWQPYRAWAHGDEEGSIYVLDSLARVLHYSGARPTKLSISDGIATMRRALSRCGEVVRLIGLSGVGKTRFVQALFDDRIGTDALAPSAVLYTDEGAEPQPSPREMMYRLGVAGRHAVVVVDNCKPETHRALTDAVKPYSKHLSLITVEYDISEDEPESTSVFRLEPSSETTLEAVLEKLARQLSQVDRRRIAEFSGGNARIALALARSAQNKTNLSRLSDAELFRRLFFQRQDQGEELLNVAEICSLVYSFDGETLDPPTSELVVLAELANVTAERLYAQVQELRRRDLVQSRSRWKAVLPHAIANRLAKSAIDKFHPNQLERVFLAKGRERLLKSLSRRLGYLHDSEAATSIAERWISDTAYLGTTEQLNDLGIALFQNLAPLSPGAALVAIEAKATASKDAFFSTKAVQRQKWMSMLRAIAFDPEYFERATWLLAQFYSAEPENYNVNSAKAYFLELFHIQLSGTHAPVEERLGLAERLLTESTPAMRSAGIAAIDAMLEANYFTSHHDFSFGGRSRDYGWRPRTIRDVCHWYQAVLGLLKRHILGNTAHATVLRKVFAQRLRGLWRQAGIDDELQTFVRTIAEAGSWPDGWLAIRSILAFDVKNCTSPDSVQLRQLETLLRPADLVAKIQAHVLSDRSSHLTDIADLDAISDPSQAVAAYQNAEVIAEELGKVAGQSLAPVQPVLEQLLRTSTGRHWSFGKGVALGCEDPEEMWATVVKAFSSIPEKEREVRFFCGYVAGLASRDSGLLERILEGSIECPTMGAYFPILQCSAPIGEAGAGRLLKSLATGLAPVYRFKQLAYGGASKEVPFEYLARILHGIVEKPHGFDVAIDILMMRFHAVKTAGEEISHGECSLARKILCQYAFDSEDRNLAYHVSELANTCLGGTDGKEAARIVAQNLVRALEDYRTRAWEYEELAAALFSLQPTVALDAFLGGRSTRNRFRLWDEFATHRTSPVNCVPVDSLLSWARKSPKTRFPRLAREVMLFANEQSANAGIGVSDVALVVLEWCPEKTAVLDAFGTQLFPGSWSGSLADILEPRYVALGSLVSHSDPSVSDWATNARAMIADRIEQERKREARSDESFE